MTRAKAWSIKHGLLLGGGLALVGLLLQFLLGPIDWQLISWPVNVYLLLFFVMLVVALHLMRGAFYPVRWLTSLPAAIGVLLWITAITLVMGLVKQLPSTQPPADALGITRMLSFWPFVLLYGWLALSLALVVLQRLLSFKCRNVPFLLLHGGILVSLLTATLGSADMQRMKLITTVGATEWRAYNQQEEMVELPIAVELNRFIMEQYDDGSPKRYASDVNIYTKSGKNFHATVDVNKPIKVDGWKIYQYGYDTAAGPESRISILELVSDPWLPAVYAGIAMMLAGAFTLLFISRKTKED